MSFGRSDKSLVKKLLKCDIPEELKKCNKTVYRVVKLNSIKQLTEDIGSWTFDKNIAIKFSRNNGWFNEFVGDKYFLLVIKNPKKENIILNIYDLFKTTNFNDIAYDYEQEGVHNGVGISLGASQKEVIIKSSLYNIDSIYERVSYKNWKKIK